MTLENAYAEAREKANVPASKTVVSSWMAEVAEPKPESDGTTTSVAKDIGRGLAEAPRQIVGGVADGLNEISNLTKDIGDWMNENVADLGGIVINEDGVSFASGKEVAASENLAQLPTTDKAESVTGGLVRGISQFLAGFGVAGKALKGVGIAAKGIGGAMAKGAIADFSAFDPQEERLSNLTQDFPALQNPVSEYLASDPEDSDAEGRFKNAIEGLALGGVADGLFKGVKIMRQARLTRKAAEADAALKATAEKLAPSEKVVSLPERVVELQGGDAPLVSISKADVTAPKAATDAQLDTFADAPIGADKAVNINLNRIDAPEDITAAIEKTAEAFKGDIDEATRGVITQEQTAKLADELGLTEDQLLARHKGQAFNAEQVIAARRIMVSSAGKVRDLALLAREGGDAELLAFKEALGRHGAIQSQISGMTAEAGRALQSFRMIVDGSSGELIDVAAREGGDIRNMAKKIAEVDSLYGLNRMAREVQQPSKADMFIEIWINGLLSSPKTHVVNMVSNGLVALYAIPERALAAHVNKAFGDGAVEIGEVTAQAYGMIKGMRDGFSLASKALITGEPSDALTKMEVKSHRAISGEAFGLSGMPGQAADFMGEAIRLPGRFLTAGDEFFKAVGYRMELNAQVFRQARSEGLEGDALANRIGELMQNTPENIKEAAVDASHYQTFTNELGGAGKAIQRLTNSHPAFKLVMPFTRTPINIVKFVGERSPLAPFAKSIRQDIAAGGARRDIAVARMAMGSTVMLIGADMTMNGDMTGAGPGHPGTKKIWRDQGYQPYSIRVGDSWFKYDRMDPIGMTLGLSADFAEIMGGAKESDVMTMATAGSLAVAKNVVSKTYLRGIMDLVEAFSSASTEEGAKNSQVERYLNRQAGTLVPFSSLMGAISRDIDPVMRQADSVMDNIKKRIPGMSKSLPPVLNMWGEEILLKGGIGPDIMSPLTESKMKFDKVNQAILDSGVEINMPNRKIRGVDLTPEQYNRYIQLSAGKEMKKSLKEMIGITLSNPQVKRLSDGPDGGKDAMVDSVVRSYRGAAQAIMLKEYPELLENATMKKIERFQ